jgi:hypothetical protein
MSSFRGVTRRPVVCSALRWLLALCVAVLVGSPLLPHDASCHVKARTDCTACTLDCASGDVRAHTAPGAVALAPLGAPLASAGDTTPLRLALSLKTGRAPPA